MISIIVPVYNTSEYLPACIESILKQTNTDWELIMVDDGSKDGSRAIIERYAASDERIKYLKKENGGVSSARNYGISHAKGDFIMFVDSDDLCHESILERLGSEMTDERDIVACRLRPFSQNVPEVQENHSVIVFDNIESLYTKFSTESLLNPPVAKLYRKDLITQNTLAFNEHMALGEDLLFNIDYLKFVNKGALVCDELYFYRNTPGSLSKTIRGDYADLQLDLFESKHNLVETRNINYDFSPKAADTVKDIFLSLCRSNAKYNDKKRTLRRLRHHRILSYCKGKQSASSKILILAIRYAPSFILFNLLK